LGPGGSIRRLSRGRAAFKLIIDPMATTEFIIRVSTNESRKCPFDGCDVVLDAMEMFENSCNHMLQDHQLVCLHVGQETVDTDDGPYQTTVAVFGR
jgi:hypothetical protein